MKNNVHDDIEYVIRFPKKEIYDFLSEKYAPKTNDELYAWKYELESVITDLSYIEDVHFALLFLEENNTFSSFVSALKEFKKTELKDIELAREKCRFIEVLSRDLHVILRVLIGIHKKEPILAQAEVFRIQADRHATEAPKWLKWILITLGVSLTFLVALLMLDYFTDYSNSKNWALLVANKISIAAIASYLLYFLSKVYFSEKHNQTVNESKQGALLAYKLLYGQATSPAEKNIILTQAAQCVFSNNETGYNQSKSPELNNSFFSLTPKADK